MVIKYNPSMTNYRLDALENYIGTAPTLRILTGSPPATVASAQTGTLLVEMALPSDWMSAASSGVKTKAGTWSGTAVATGTAGYFRILNNNGGSPDPDIQGTAGISGTDMILDGAVITSGQVVSVLTFTITAAGA